MPTAPNQPRLRPDVECRIAFIYGAMCVCQIVPFTFSSASLGEVGDVYGAECRSNQRNNPAETQHLGGLLMVRHSRCGKTAIHSQRLDQVLHAELGRYAVFAA